MVVPAGDPWQKKPQASKEDRLAMTCLGLEDLSVDVSDCEVARSGPSYAFDTVKILKAQNPLAKATWIIGSDALPHLSSWKNFEELVKSVEFLVVNRPGHLITSTDVHPDVQWSSTEVAALDISATEIRETLATGGDVSQLIPAKVAGYIAEKRLYGAA